MQSMNADGIYAIPNRHVSTSDLEELLGHTEVPQAAAVALDRIRAELSLPQDAPLLIKPAADGCSTGVMRLQHPQHLATYALAVTQKWPHIPPELTPGVFSRLRQCLLTALDYSCALLVGSPSL